MLETWLVESATRLRRENRPLITLSYAQSLDGSIALERGSPLAISGVESTRMTHRLRAAHDAIIVGIGTVESDDPQLTVRQAEGESPIPVILDSHLRTSEKARIFQHPRKPIIACLENAVISNKAQVLTRAGATILPVPGDKDGHISLPGLLELLRGQEIESIMVEGGATVITAFLQQDLVDRVVLTIAPIFIGGLKALEKPVGLPANKLLNLKNVNVEAVGNDLVVFSELDR
jgi:riboflavin-specific deaminase-like protein